MDWYSFVRRFVAAWVAMSDNTALPPLVLPSSAVFLAICRLKRGRKREMEREKGSEPDDWPRSFI